MLVSNSGREAPGIRKEATMSGWARLSLAFLLLLPFAANASAAEIHGTCDIRFAVSTTLQGFTGTGHCLPFAAPLQKGPAGGEVLPLVTVDVAIGEMKTGVSGRDRDMRKMFHESRFPLIRGTARDIDVDALTKRMRTDPSGTAPLEISLTIRDVEQKIPATASNLKEEGGKVTFDIGFPVRLSDFYVTAPTVFGFIHVNDRVDVKANFSLEVPREAASPRASFGSAPVL